MNYSGQILSTLRFFNRFMSFPISLCPNSCSHRFHNYRKTSAGWNAVLVLAKPMVDILNLSWANQINGVSKFSRICKSLIYIDLVCKSWPIPNIFDPRQVWKVDQATSHNHKFDRAIVAQKQINKSFVYFSSVGLLWSWVTISYN